MPELLEGGVRTGGKRAAIEQLVEGLPEGDLLFGGVLLEFIDRRTSDASGGNVDDAHQAGGVIGVGA